MKDPAISADFDLSMVLRGRDEGAAAAARGVETALGGVERATASGTAATANRARADNAAAGSADKLAAATADQSAQLRTNADLMNQVIRATNPLVSTQGMLDAAVRRVGAAYIAGKTSAEVYTRAQQLAARATRENIEWQTRAGQSAGQMRVGTMMLGQQIQDIGIQLASGTGLLRTFAMQAGQTALAVQQMGGAGAGVARFIGGPFGSLILAGVSVLAMLTAGMMANADAAEAAHVGADGLSDAQGVLGAMFDMTSGKIEHQNSRLRANITLMAVQMQAQAMQERDQARATYQSLGYRGNAARFGTIGEAIRLGVSPTQIPEAQRRTDAYTLRVQRLLTDVGAGRLSSERALQLSAQIDFSGLNVTREDFQQAIINRLSSSAKDQTASRMLSSLNAGVLDPSLRRDRAGRRGGRGRHPADHSAQLAEFGRDTSDRIASLTGGFEDVPPQVEKVNRAMRQLDDILDDVSRRRPPNFQALLDQGERARAVIEDGINKPYRDFLHSQEEALNIAHLQAIGQNDQADAMRIILQLEQQMGPLGPARRDAILASVQALRAEQREMDILHEQQQRQLSTLNDIKTIITDTLASGLRTADQIPKRLLAAFNQYSANYFFEKIFGDNFRQLQDRINGQSIASDAAERFRTAVHDAEAATVHSSATLDGFTAAVQRATGAVAGAGPGFTGPAGTTGGPGGFMGDMAALFGMSPGAFAASMPALPGSTAAGAGDDQGPIVVTAQRGRATVPRDPAGFFSYVITNLAHGVLGDAAATKIGQVAGRGLEGAAVGGAVAGVGKLFGIKTSSTGGQIGGAIGGMAAKLIPGMPPIVGELIGSVLGSLVGGLFAPKPKSGEAVVSRGSATATGNSATLNKTAMGLAGNIQDAIAQIAQQLGGGLGDYKVSIGTYKDTYRVNTSGGPTHGDANHVNFGEDQAAAVSFAILDALKDGAVTGLSKAVTAALGSSTDIQKALTEALNVQNLETLIGGLPAQLAKPFKDFDALAAQRIDLAKKYGLDVLAVEKINADERVKLLKDTLQSRVGSLLSFQKDMSYGDLYEGDASTRRDAILKDIGDAKKDAEAGVAGAADTLAQLYKTLLGTSKEAFGTAGPEYATDRADAASEVAKVIQMENDRIAAAANMTQAQIDALEAGNELTSETNDLLAITNQKLDVLAGVSAGGGGSGGDLPASTIDLGFSGSGLGRFTNLQLA